MTKSHAHSINSGESEPTRFDQLTGLRFVAALGVMVCHFSQVLGVPETGRFLTDFFGSFVELFFVLSGFVLTHQYAHRLGNSQALRTYAVARVARIVPMYWLALIVMLILYWATDFAWSLGGTSEYELKAASFYINFVALQAWFPDAGIQQYWNAPGWSVSAELFFYACLPLVLRWVHGSTRTLVALWVAIALFLGGYFWACHTLWGDQPITLLIATAYAARCPLMGLYCFVMGVHLARTWSTPVGSQGPGASTRSVLLFAALVVATSYAVASSSTDATVRLRWQILATYLVYAPFFYCLIQYLLRHPGRLSATLAKPYWVVLGDASYALYIIHWIPLTVLLSGPAWLRAGWVIPWSTAFFTVLLSVLLFYGFEQPLRLWIRRHWR